MALKPDRNHAEVTDIRQHWTDTQTSAEKGGMTSLFGQGAGVAMDSPATPSGTDGSQLPPLGSNVVLPPDANEVGYAAAPSGAVPMGVLLQDVNPALSNTRDHKNHSNLEVRAGDKVTLVRQGNLVTDMITGNPVAGAVAWLGTSGNMSTTGGPGIAVVGRFETTKDVNGFARVAVQIP